MSNKWFQQPWWLDYDLKRSSEEGRARQTIILLFGAIAIAAIWIVQWPIGAIGLHGNAAFAVLVAITFPPSLAIAKVIAAHLRPGLFKDAERNWKRRNGIYD